MRYRLLDGKQTVSKRFRGHDYRVAVLQRISGTWPENQSLKLECALYAADGLVAGDRWTPADLAYARTDGLRLPPRELELAHDLQYRLVLAQPGTIVDLIDFAVIADSCCVEILTDPDED